MKIIIALFSLCLITDAVKDCKWVTDRLDSRKKELGLESSSTAEEDDIINRIYPYAKDIEILLNFQIRNEMNAFYNYLSMSYFFQSEEYYLEGFSKFFHDAAMEELKHAEMFMKYQAKRGGRNFLHSLPEPGRQTWSSGLHVMKSALELEKNVTDEVLCLHKLADDRYNDVDLVNLLEGEVIPEQYSGMKELASHVKTLQRIASAKGKSDNKNYGLSEFYFDQTLKEKSS